MQVLRLRCASLRMTIRRSGGEKDRENAKAATDVMAAFGLCSVLCEARLSFRSVDSSRERCRERHEVPQTVISSFSLTLNMSSRVLI